MCLIYQKNVFQGKKKTNRKTFKDRLDLCSSHKPNFPWLQEASQTPTSRKQLASSQCKRLGGLLDAKSNLIKGPKLGNKGNLTIQNTKKYRKRNEEYCGEVFYCSNIYILEVEISRISLGKYSCERTVEWSVAVSFGKVRYLQYNDTAGITLD